MNLVEYIKHYKCCKTLKRSNSAKPVTFLYKQDRNKIVKIKENITAEIESMKKLL